MASANAAVAARKAVALLGGPRARSVAAVLGVGAVDLAAAVVLGDWDSQGVFLGALGLLLAATAGAFGGIVAGVAAGLTGWGVEWALVVHHSPPALVALLLWVATGAVGGLLAIRVRSVATARDDDLRRARAEQRDSNAKYLALAQSLPVVTYVRAPGSGGLLFASDRIERLTGYSPDEWRRDPALFLRLVHEDDRERVEQELAPSADPGGGMRSEYRLVTRDGRVVWVEEEAVTVLDAEGRPLCVQGWLLDVTDRRTAAEDRRELRREQETAAAAARDRQRRLDFLGRAAALLTSSYDDREAIQRAAARAVRDVAVWCIVDRLEEDGTWTRVAAERAEGSPLDEPDVDLRELVERRRPFLTASELAVPLVSPAGRTLGALTLAADERLRGFDADDVGWAAALAVMIALAIDSSRLHDEVEARADADRVLSYVADGVFLLDRGGVVRLWNPMAEAVTGLSADATLGRAANDVIPGWEQIAERVPITAAGEVAAVEALPLETERGERWISISGVEFFGGTVFAFRDITDAHRLDELQAEFIATASHELRTPLAAVYGAAQTLRRHDFALDEAGRERFISLIVDESERLGRIVNQILLANQLEMGRVDLDTDGFDAAELLERVAEASRAHAPPHIRVAVVVGDAVPPVAADKDHVRQILINLVENAIKYSPDGGTIELGVEAIEDLALFRVVDEGLGIPATEQPRVFEKFYRLDPNMTRGIGGTGLGLYICSELVERMGGRIWVESRQEKGSTFFFELPTVAPSRLPARPREVSGVERGSL